MGEKQKVQMGAWVLAHSRHVSHEIKQRPRGLCSGASICFDICFPRPHVLYSPEGVCASCYDDGKLQTEGYNEIQTHILRIIDLQYSARVSKQCSSNWHKVGFRLQLFVPHKSNRSCQVLFFFFCCLCCTWLRFIWGSVANAQHRRKCIITLLKRSCNH